MPLSDFWSNEVMLYNSKVVALSSAMDELQRALPDLDAELNAKQREIRDRTDEIARKRRELAVATVPAEANLLLESIREAMVNQRRLFGELLDLRRKREQSGRELAATQAARTRAQADVARAAQALERENAASALRSAALAALGTAPLNTLAADAAAIVAAYAPDSLGSLDALPDELKITFQTGFSAARNALEVEEGLIQRASEMLANLAGDEEGTFGELVAARMAFLKAEEQVLWLAANGQSQLERATRLVARVTVEPLLTGAEVFALLANTERTDAADHASDVLAALEAVREKQQERDHAILTALSANPEADLRIDTTVTIPEGELNEAREALQDARNAFTDRAAFRNWTVVVPDEAVRKLCGYFEALAIAQKLSAIVVTDVGAALETAESTYADALLNDAAVRRRRQYLEDTLALHTGALDALTRSVDETSLSALRGDTL